MEIAVIVNMSSYNHRVIVFFFCLVFVDNDEVLRDFVFVAILEDFGSGNVLECCFGAVVVYSVTHVWKGRRPCAFFVATVLLY